MLTACESSVKVADDGGVCVEVRKDIPVFANRDLDILLVIDSSPSMAEEASALAENLSRFVSVLETIDSGLPNVHIGVVSADIAQGNGRLQSAPQIDSCLPPQDNYLRDIGYLNGERDKNYGGTLAESLACIATLAPTMAVIEEPLEAMKRALDGSNTENIGFVREHAFLLVLIVSDEDDCSGGVSLSGDGSESNTAWRCFDDAVQCDQATDTPGIKTNCHSKNAPTTLTPLAEYVDFLRSYKQDPGKVVVASVGASGPVEVLAGNELTLASSCPGNGSAKPAIRLAEFLAGFPQRNSDSDICEEDWSEALEVIASTTPIYIGPGCIAGTDLDPEVAGVQHECVVSQIQDLGTDDESELILPECVELVPGEEERPCWRIFESPECVQDGEALIEVYRGRESIKGNTIVRARCHSGC